MMSPFSPGMKFKDFVTCSRFSLRDLSFFLILPKDEN